MTLDEFLNVIHKFREKRAEELREVPVEERVRLANELACEFADEHGLTVVKPAEHDVIK